MRRCEIEAAKGNLCQGVLKPLYRGYFQPKELARGELFAPSLSVNVLAGSLTCRQSCRIPSEDQLQRELPGPRTADCVLCILARASGDANTAHALIKSVSRIHPTEVR
jgi:hypothetical protein